MLESTDAKNKLEDLSGVALLPGENPYSGLIDACDDDPREIQTVYATHRTTRNAQQKEKFLSDEFKEVLIDPFLLRLENPELEPGFHDPRNCLVFWARPPDHVLKLAGHLQSLLLKKAPSMWLMPQYRMHMTTLEITHSREPGEIVFLTHRMKEKIPALTNYTFLHRTRLVKPMLSYDLAAVALSFLPAVGEPIISPDPTVGPFVTHGDEYTYHHLRRDVFDLARTTGVEIGSRYVVPSAHITLGRFLTQQDHATPEARLAWVQAIDEINAWLEAEVWNDRAAEKKLVGEWIVGQERGLDCRAGRLWYGGGRTVMLGEGF